MTDLRQPPPDANLADYTSDHMAFAYPAGAEVVAFEPASIRVVVWKDDGDRLRFNIKRRPGQPDARELAQTRADATPAFVDPTGTLPPHEISTDRFTGWRCRSRFVDGGRVGELIDSAFLTVGESVYSLELMASHDEHAAYGWILDTLIATFDAP